jgi:KamA family protein
MEQHDSFTHELFLELYSPSSDSAAVAPPALPGEIQRLFRATEDGGLTQPVVGFFAGLLSARREYGISPSDLGFSREELEALARRHAEIDEHGVTVGGRLLRALPIAGTAGTRVADYLAASSQEAPSGIELWERIQENTRRIQRALGISPGDWESFPGQMRHLINSVEELAALVDLPPAALEDVLRVTRTYRMRLTPYYASLIMPGVVNDPVLLQSVPTGEMVDNVGEEIAPVAADHSPARLIDQFYPRVVTIKATNMCAMYCTHCLRIAHIGKQDRTYCDAAYGEALDYIRRNPSIRDVLVTGGDAFMLPNSLLRWLLEELDAIEHVRVKRLGTRIPVTAPMRLDEELLDILEASNDRKPLRVVTQINTAQEITPVSREGFRRISGRVMTVLNQAVLLRGINDTRTKMWKLCETIHEAYVRPYYIFNCSFRNPQFAHLRVPVGVGRDIVESMYGNLSGDSIPRYIATAGGKVPLHRDNVVREEDGFVVLQKPWSGEEVAYPDADPAMYADAAFAFARY